MTDFKDDAQACISLKYKYSSMITCVQEQRPSLLNDPILGLLFDQKARITALFDARVEELAGDYND